LICRGNRVFAPHTGAPDTPDLAFVDSNCDGIDCSEKNAIFVSPQGQDSNPGTKGAPKRDIRAAVAAAAAAVMDVYAAAGVYGHAGVATGVGIYGGYKPENWARGRVFVTTIVGTPEGIYADGETGVVLQHLTVRGEAGPEPGASAYGIRLVNGASVKLQRIVAHAHAERWVGSVRRECLDRLLIFSRRQLEHVLRVYARHYNQHRPHRALALRPPEQADGNPTPLRAKAYSQLNRRDLLGGLIDEYERAA
jgi:Integrase core domain